MDDFCLYAVAAADEALKDAGLPLDMRDGSVVNPDRVGVCVGSGIGGMRTMEQQCEVLLEKGPGRISPFLIPMMISIWHQVPFLSDMGRRDPISRLSLRARQLHTLSVNPSVRFSAEMRTS